LPADKQGPTLQSILDSWASSSSIGTPQSRRAFNKDLSNPDDILEILLRLTRGDRNSPVSLSSSSRRSLSPGPTGAFAGAAADALSTFKSTSTSSPYASHQTHVSLAILAMYRLTTDYAVKAGETKSALEEKVGDIIRSLPVGMINKSLEGMWREWSGASGAGGGGGSGGGGIGGGGKGKR
jgi:20S proteasome subunit alpha 6